MKKLYLSPSIQSGNKYAVGNTNEKVQCEKIAARVKALFDRDYECETVLSTLSFSLEQRIAEAKSKGCGYYFPIHTNAGSSTASGAVSFFYPGQTAGQNLANAIVKGLNAVCPVKSNRASPVTSKTGWTEIDGPFRNGQIPVYIEVDFHDNPKTAQWLIDSTETIAAALCKAIADTAGIKKKAVTPPPSPAKNPYAKPSVTLTLKRGSKGDAVKWLQWELRNRKYNITVIDGDFGAQTESAVRAFQTAQKIVSDGIVGSQTYAKLGNTATTPTPTPTPTPAKPVNPYKEPTVNLKLKSTGDGVKWVQWWLKQKGYSITVDGSFGAQTDSVVKQFQKAKKLVVDGIVGAQTRTALKS